jgi:hypothetical protein
MIILMCIGGCLFYYNNLKIRDVIAFSQATTNKLYIYLFCIYIF